MCKSTSLNVRQPRSIDHWREVFIAVAYRFVLVMMCMLSCQISVTLADEGDDVEYTFGRPVTEGEHTYDWYRKTHADWAAKRYGVDPVKVGDGMDTWHWWCGVDNPGFWREMAKVTGKNENVLTAKIDLLGMLHAVPRAERWEKIGL